MSDLFMDMHCRGRRWHYQQNTTPPTSTTVATATTILESPSSIQNERDHIFSHHYHKSSTTDGEDAAPNDNYNVNNQENVKDNNHDNNHNCDDEDTVDNILSLQLRKPRHWKWELSTSKSCSNIALPRILLYDHKGRLLVDAQDDNERVYKSKVLEKSKRDKSNKRAHQSKQQQQPEYLQRSATTNLTHSIRQALENEFSDLHIQEITPSPKSHSPISLRSHNSRKAIDLNTTDLPDYALSRRSSSLRGVRFDVENNEDHPLYESQIPEFLPTPPSTTTHTSSSSGPRQKRKYRRSQSSGRSSAHSESILERISYQKGRFSSPEYAEEKEIQHGPCYFLRTCKAGTLVVKEDSFHQHPRRRKRMLKNHSTESLHNLQKTLHSSPIPTPQPSACKIPTPRDINSRRHLQPLHRHLTNGNILPNKQLSTSSDEDAVCQKPLMDNVSSRHLRKYAQTRNQTKADLNYEADVHQKGKVR